MDYHGASFARFHQSSRPPPYPQAADRNDALLSSSSSDPCLRIPRLFDPSPSFTFSALPQPRGRDPFHAGAGPGAVAALPGAAPLTPLSSRAAHHADVAPGYAAYQAASAASLAAAAGIQQFGVDPATYGGVVSVVFFQEVFFYGFLVFLGLSMLIDAEKVIEISPCIVIDNVLLIEH